MPVSLYLEEKGQPPSNKKKQSSSRHHQTLEDVAEEMINGIFCHYEPPDPPNKNARGRQHERDTKHQRYHNHKYPSILRNKYSGGGAAAAYADGKQRQSNKQKQQQQRQNPRRVRWYDEKKESRPPKPETVAAKRGKRMVKDEEEQPTTTIIDPTTTKGSDPPAQVEPTGCSVAQACLDAGMEVGCVSKKMDAEEAIAMARAKSPRNNRVDDEEIVFDDEGNPTYADPEIKKKQPPPPPPPPVPPPNKKERFFPQLCGVRINCCDDAQAQLQTLASSSLSFDVSLNNNNSNDDVQATPPGDKDEVNSLVDEPLQQESPIAKAFSRKLKGGLLTFSPKRSDVSDSDNGSEEDWEDTSSTSSSLLRRILPRKSKYSPKNKMDTIEEFDSSEDERISSPGRGRGRRRSSSRSRSPAGRRKQPPEHPFPSDDPITMTRSESSVSKTLGLGFLKGKPKKQAEESSDWDESIPIPSSSTSTSSKSNGSRGRDRNKERRENKKERRSKSPARREKTERRTKSPVRRLLNAAGNNGPASNDPRGKFPAEHLNGRLYHPAYPLIHPAHPLNNTGAGGTNMNRDEVMERQSFITAHRQGFDGRGSVANDDQLERQSFITSYRRGQDESNEDDQMERQSFITAYRRDFDPPTYPRESRPPLSHDDMMERMSFITASRQDMDVANLPPQRAQQTPKLQNSTKKPEQPSTMHNKSNGLIPPVGQAPVPSQGAQRGLPIPVNGMVDPQTGLYYPDPRAMYFSGGHQQGKFPKGFPMYPLPPVQLDPNGQPNVYHGHPGQLSEQQKLDNQVSHSGSTTEETQQKETPNEQPNEDEKKDESEMTWEERTRQAWERIRGGVEALTFQTPKDEEDRKIEKTEEKKEENQDESTGTEENDNTGTGKKIPVVEATDPVEPSSYSGGERRVSFGEPQHMVSYYQYPYEYDPSMFYREPRAKKKKKFRGTKLLGGAFGKVKNSLRKVSLTRSRSSESMSETQNATSHSSDWDAANLADAPSNTYPYGPGAFEESPSPYGYTIDHFHPSFSEGAATIHPYMHGEYIDRRAKNAPNPTQNREENGGEHQSLERGGGAQARRAAYADPRVMNQLHPNQKENGSEHHGTGVQPMMYADQSLERGGGAQARGAAYADPRVMNQLHPYGGPMYGYIDPRATNSTSSQKREGNGGAPGTVGSYIDPRAMNPSYPYDSPLPGAGPQPIMYGYNVDRGVPPGATNPSYSGQMRDSNGPRLMKPTHSNQNGDDTQHRPVVKPPPMMYGGQIDQSAMHQSYPSQQRTPGESTLRDVNSRRSL